MKRHSHSLSIAYVALGAVLICIGSWISIPSPIPFTLQTLSVFLVLLLLGGMRGTVCILVYLSLGALGFPVFGGFRGGVGALLSATGGFLFGFVAAALVFWLLTSVFDSPLARIAAMGLGMLLCYAMGTLWYAFLYTGGASAGIGGALLQCVVPFIIPDILKIACAYMLSGVMKRRLRLGL